MKLVKASQIPIVSASLQKLLREIAPQCPIANIIQLGLNRDCYRPAISTWQYHFGIFNPEPIGNHFSFREKENMVSYCPTGRTQQMNDEGTWKRDGRVEMKPAKFLRAMLHPRLAKRFKDHQFAQFSEKFRAAESSLHVTFQYVEFESGYDSTNHQADSPAECDSCMRDENVGPFYRAYGAQCLVAVNKKGIYLGRAIVWPAVHGIVTGASVQFMDRVYAESPETAELFFQYAAANGIYRKKSQNSSNKTGFIAPDGSCVTTRAATIDLAEGKNLNSVSFWPYCDTFQWMDPDTAELKNCGNYGDSELDNTDGEITENSGQLCEDGNRYPEDECVYVTGHGYYHQDSDDIVGCADGEYRLRDDCFYCERNDEHYPNSEGYAVEIRRNGRTETIYIHEDHVSRL